MGRMRPSQLFLQPGQPGLPMVLHPQPASAEADAEPSLYGSPEELLRCANGRAAPDPQR